MKTLASPSHHLGTTIGFMSPLSSSQQEMLKWLALCTMTLDHLNKYVLQSNYPALLWLGRLAFPLFAFLIAYNLIVRAVKPTRYLWPLLLFALATQPVLMWVTKKTTGNILFTLCLGVLYVGLKPLLEKGFPKILVHGLLVVILFIPSLQVQYGPAGVFLIPVLAAFLKRPTALGYGLTCLYLVAVNTVSDSSILAFFVSPAHGLYTTLAGLEPYTFMPLFLFPVVVFISRLPLTLTRANTWFFYAFYPAHLVALHLLASYIG